MNTVPRDGNGQKENIRGVQTLLGVGERDAVPEIRERPRGVGKAGVRTQNRYFHRAPLRDIVCGKRQKGARLPTDRAGQYIGAETPTVRRNRPRWSRKQSRRRAGGLDGRKGEWGAARKNARQRENTRQRRARGAATEGVRRRKNARQRRVRGAESGGRAMSKSAQQ